MRGKPWAAAITKFAVSAVLVGVLLNAVGVQDAVARIASADPLWLSAAGGVAVFQVMICAERWRGVLVGIGAAMRFKDAFMYWYIGAFFNQTLPSAVGGDAVRGYLAYKDGLGFAPALSSLILERVATVLALVALTAALTPFVADGLDGGVWFQRAVWLVFAGALAGTALMMILDRMPKNWTRFRVVRGLVALARDARSTLLNPLNALRVMGWSIIGHINLSLVVYALARALNVDLSVLDCLVMFPPVLLVQSVPITVAGWGVREGAMVAVFALTGVAAQDALAMSILYGLILAVVSVPGALLWLASGKRTLKDAEAFAVKADIA